LPASGRRAGRRPAADRAALEAVGEEGAVEQLDAAGIDEDRVVVERRAGRQPSKSPIARALPNWSKLSGGPISSPFRATTRCAESAPPPTPAEEPKKR